MSNNYSKTVLDEDPSCVTIYLLIRSSLFVFVSLRILFFIISGAGSVFEDYKKSAFRWMRSQFNPESRQQRAPSPPRYFEGSIEGFQVHAGSEHEREKQWHCRCTRL